MKRLSAFGGKRVLLCLCICAYFSLSGCFIQPDRTLDPLAGEADQLPFSTLAPTPEPTETPVPTEAPQATPGPTAVAEYGSDWQSWGDLASGTGTTAPGGVDGAAVTPVPAATSWQTSTEDYNAGYPVLKVGSSGNDVYDMQERLKELGYYTGTLDGKFASGTQEAVKSFQESNGLTVDGVAGRATQDKLYSASAQAKTVSVSSSSGSSSGSGGSSASSVLKNGSSGTEVRKLQVRLSELGYYAGGADGIFGSTTEAAVKEFQRRNNLTADGQAGSATLGKVYASDAKSASRPVATADPNAVRTLSLGMEGNDVYSMQKKLVELGYLSGVADAVFGSETDAALRAFQQANGLTVDGAAGASTLNKLSSSSAKKANTPAATATPTPGDYAVLKEGDSGEYVYDIQERLYDLGYYSGRIDGRFGANTTAAVEAFQQANGLAVDGVAGAGTQRTLFSPSAVASPGTGVATAQPGVQTTPAPATGETYTTLREGSTGQAVSRMQQYLFELGYYDGRVDGTYGARMTSAVRKFQLYNGLTEDGVAGPATQEFLYSGQAIPLPAAVTTPEPDKTLNMLQGDSGLAVEQMQHRLFLLGYLEERQITGTYGYETTVAVRTFQEINGLKMDGAAGPETLGALYDANAEPYGVIGGSD